MSGTALVVGGSRGIGKASACELARNGFDPVVIVYLADEAAASAARRAVEELGARSHVVRADAATDTGLAAVLAALDDAPTPLAAVVYSAAYRTLGASLTHDSGSWQRALDVTLTGFVRTVQATSSRLTLGGRIVGISGLSGLRAYSSSHLAMGTAKAASHHAMTYLAWDLADRGINLNMVCCGSVETEGVKRDLTAEQYDDFISATVARIPRRRLASPEEVAKVVAFLCSPAAELLVGQVIVADGGETLR